MKKKLFIFGMAIVSINIMKPMENLSSLNKKKNYEVVLNEVQNFLNNNINQIKDKSLTNNLCIAASNNESLFTKDKLEQEEIISRIKKYQNSKLNNNSIISRLDGSAKLREELLELKTSLYIDLIKGLFFDNCKQLDGNSNKLLSSKDICNVYADIMKQNPNYQKIEQLEDLYKQDEIERKNQRIEAIKDIQQEDSRASFSLITTLINNNKEKESLTLQQENLLKRSYKKAFSNENDGSYGSVFSVESKKKFITNSRQIKESKSDKSRNDLDLQEHVDDDDNIGNNNNINNECGDWNSEEEKDNKQ